MPTAASSRPAPIVLTLERSDGHRVDLANYRGLAVLLVAFTMDHLPSQALLRHLETLARAHPDDLRVVAISGDRHPRERHRELLQIFGSVLGLERTELVLADDALRNGASPLGVIERVPTIFLVNRAGAIARRVEGYLDLPALRTLIAPALPRGY